MMDDAERYLRMAIELAAQNVRDHQGQPFGAVLVKDGKVVGTGVNEVLATNDPTAHAEVNALRVAGPALKNPSLVGAVMYTSGHPCPMCLSSMYMAGIRDCFYAYSIEDSTPFGLS